MANLKGSDFNRQKRDANFRLAAFGQKRNGTGSHKTHSEALRVKRDRYLSDFKKFAEEKELDGKLNELMNEANLSEFFENRLDGMSFSSQEDYLRGWSGLVQGLQQSNITIGIDGNFFDGLVSSYKDGSENIGALQIDPSIIPSEVIAQLPDVSAIIAQLQYETGYRINEAYSVINDIENYLMDLKLKAVQGKGGQQVREKIISLELRLMLLKLQKENSRIPHRTTYYRHLQIFGMRSHDFRAFYTKELYAKKREEGLSHVQACRYVSIEINHRRIVIVEYYLSKFGGLA